MKKVLLIDDDAALLDGLEMLLGGAGHRVDRAESITEATHMLESFSYDLLIVDWNLPDGNGPDLTERLRRKRYDGPIIMLTAKDAIQSKEYGFHKGADDYLCKPFEPRELVARVSALLRRNEKSYSNVLELGNLVLDLTNQSLVVAGKELGLQPQEFQVMRLLLKHPGDFFSNEQLLKRLWPSDSDSGVETVRTTVYKLRKKITNSHANHVIETQYKLGYRLVATDKCAAPVDSE